MQNRLGHKYFIKGKIRTNYSVGANTLLGNILRQGSAVRFSIN